MPETNSEKIPQKYVGLIAHNILWDNQEDEEAFPSGFSRSNTWMISGQNQNKIFVYTNTALANQDNREIIDVDYLGCQESITQKGLLDCSDDEIQELIYQIKISISITNGTKIANRLLELYNYSKEEDSETIGISTESLQNFFSFPQKNTTINYPAISLTQDRNIYASWRSESGDLCSVHFLKGYDVRFVMFIKNYRHPEQKLRLSGTATSDILMETIAPYNVNEWMKK